jgi:hypothetical protein
MFDIAILRLNVNMPDLRRIAIAPVLALVVSLLALVGTTAPAHADTDYYGWEAWNNLRGYFETDGSATITGQINGGDPNRLIIAAVWYGGVTSYKSDLSSGVMPSEDWPDVSAGVGSSGEGYSVVHLADLESGFIDSNGVERDGRLEAFPAVSLSTIFGNSGGTKNSFYLAKKAVIDPATRTYTIEGLHDWGKWVLLIGHGDGTINMRPFLYPDAQVYEVQGGLPHQDYEKIDLAPGETRVVDIDGRPSAVVDDAGSLAMGAPSGAVYPGATFTPNVTKLPEWNDDLGTNPFAAPACRVQTLQGTYISALGSCSGPITINNTQQTRALVGETVRIRAWAPSTATIHGWRQYQTDYQTTLQPIPVSVADNQVKVIYDEPAGGAPMANEGVQVDTYNNGNPYFVDAEGNTRLIGNVEWLVNGQVVDPGSWVFEPTPAQVGGTLSVRITSSAAAAYQSKSITTSLGTIQAARFNYGSPEVIPGPGGWAGDDPAIGEKVAFELGNWAPNGVTLHWQIWSGCCEEQTPVVVPGATGSWVVGSGSAPTPSVTATQALADAYADSGGQYYLGISVWAQDAQGLSRKRHSDVAYVQAFAPTTGTPTISGEVRVDRTVTAGVGNWTAGTEFAYQWMLNGMPIGGATGQSYTLKPADAGKSLTVTVTGSQDGYASVSQTSAARTVALGTFTNQAKPTIKGKFKVRKVVKQGKAAKWSAAGVTVTFQWMRGNKAIPGAVAKSYKLKKADSKKKVSLQVTATKPGYAPVSVRSVAKKVK